MAKQEPINMYEFISKFPNEDTCQKFLFKLRWPDGFICPNCGNIGYYYLSGYHRYQCASCDFQTSITAGTVMHKTHTPLMKWFVAIYLVATDKRGCSALTIQRHINVNYKTAWLMLHKVRHAMGQRDSDYVLEGFIQADEIYLGSSKGKQGRGTEKVPAFVAVSTEIADNGEAIPMFARIKIADKINGETAKNFINAVAVKGSTVVTDCLNIYNSLPEEGFRHEKYLSDSLEGQKALEWLHIIVSNAKAFIIGTYHGLSNQHLQAYANEYCYRFNRRHWIDELFPRLLSACVSTSTVTWAELTG